MVTSIFLLKISCKNCSYICMHMYSLSIPTYTFLFYITPIMDGIIFSTCSIKSGNWFETLPSQFLVFFIQVNTRLNMHFSKPPYRFESILFWSCFLTTLPSYLYMLELSIWLSIIVIFFRRAYIWSHCALSLLEVVMKEK